MKKIIIIVFLLGLTFFFMGVRSVFAQSNVYRIEQPLPYITDSVRFISWKLINYPQSPELYWKLLQDSTSITPAMEGTATIPDNLRIYLGGPNEYKIPRWLDSTAVWIKNDQ